MANAENKRLVVDVMARVDKLEKGMARAAANVNTKSTEMEARTKRFAMSFEGNMTAAVSKVNGALSKLGIGGLAAGGIAGVVAGFREIARGVAQIGDEAKRAGVSVKAFQELKFVAEQNRIGVDALTDGLKELNLRADEWITTGSGPAAEAFARLGYSSTELATKLKDPSALFTEIIGKLGQLDKAAQIRVADEIFGGTAGERFVELIGQGEAGIRGLIQTANEGGHVIDERLVKKAAELDAKFNAVASTVGTALKTAIVEAAASLERFVDLFREIDDKSLQTLERNLAGLGMKRVDTENEILRLREEQRNITGLFAEGERKIAEAAIKAKEEELRLLSEEEKKYLSILEKRKAINNVPAAPVDAGIVPFAQLPPDDANRRVQLASARESIAKIEGAGSGGYSAVGAITSSGDRAYGKYQVMGANIAEWSKQALGTALTSEQFLNNPALQDKIFDHIFSGYIDKFGMEGASQAWFGGAGAVGKTGRQDMHGTSVGEYGNRFTAGLGQAADAWEGLRDVTASTRTETAALALEYQSFGQIAQNAMQGLVSALSDGKLEGKELLGILMNVVQQLLSMPASGGAGGSGISGIIGAIFGGLAKREAGGPVAAGQPYIVGEKRPEVFVPHTSGRIVPRVPSAPTLQPRNQSQTVKHESALTVHISGASGDDHVRTLVKQGVGEALAAQNDNMRRGGFGTLQTRYGNQKS